MPVPKYEYPALTETSHITIQCPEQTRVFGGMSARTFPPGVEILDLGRVSLWGKEGEEEDVRDMPSPCGV